MAAQQHACELQACCAAVTVAQANAGQQGHSLDASWHVGKLIDTMLRHTIQRLYGSNEYWVLLLAHEALVMLTCIARPWLPDIDVHTPSVPCLTNHSLVLCSTGGSTLSRQRAASPKARPLTHLLTHGTPRACGRPCLLVPVRAISDTRWFSLFFAAGVSLLSTHNNACERGHITKPDLYSAPCPR
jgi:hypothetical protein